MASDFVPMASELVYNCFHFPCYPQNITNTMVAPVAQNFHSLCPLKVNSEMPSLTLPSKDSVMKTPAFVLRLLANRTQVE